MTKKTIRWNGQVINPTDGAKLEEYDSSTESWVPFEATEEGDVVSNNTMNRYVKQEISNANNNVSVDVLNPAPVVPGESFLFALNTLSTEIVSLPNIPSSDEIVVSDYTTTGYIQLNFFGKPAINFSEEAQTFPYVTSGGYVRDLKTDVDIAVPGEKVVIEPIDDSYRNTYLLVAITVVE